MGALLYVENKGERKVMSNGGAFKQLRKNTLVIAIANIGSKAITFILAPLYSYYLTTSQYGTMDLITTTMSLVIPFYCLDIYEATFRFSNDDEYNSGQVLSSALAVCIPSLVITVASIIGCLFFGNQAFYIVYTLIYIALGSLINILSQFARGQNRMKVFAATGVVNSLVLLAANSLFLIALKLQITGWLISYFVAQFATVIYLVIKCNVLGLVKRKNIDKEYIRTFIKFCAPLIPTTAMWWVMNASDRYMVAFFLGTGLNGVYSVANKLPTILSVFENVFYQAWQTTAILTMNDNDRDRIYSDVFNRYLKFLAIGVVGLLVIGHPMIYLFADDYAESWTCMAPLIVGVLVHALAGNLGSLYSVFKNTKGALFSTIAGAVTNIVLNVIFIPCIGIIGAALTTLIGYLVTLVYRWVDVKKFVKITLNKKEAVIYSVIILVQLLLYYVDNTFSYIVRVGITLGILYENRKMLYKLVKN